MIPSKQIIFFSAGILLLSLMISCSEFLTKDISESDIQLISPKDSLYTSSSEITFWWERNADIEAYRIQVVSPDFDNPVSIFDTLLNDDLLFLSADEGRYIWQIRGENEGSFSEYQQRQFVIDQSEPDQPQAIFPIDTLDRGKDPLQLRWTSRDKPIDGIISAVSDSLWIYDSSETPVASFVSQNKLAELSALNLEPNQSYLWLISSQDQAGNITRSDTFTFFLK